MAKNEKKSGYDADKDLVMAEFGEIFEDSGLYAELRSYNEGEPKLSLYRKVGKDKNKTRQIFRLPVREVAVLRDFLNDLDLVQIILDVTED